MNEPKPISADAVRLLHESMEAHKRNDLQHSYQLLLGAVAEDPNLTGAWNNMGVLLHTWKRWAPAAVAFYRAHVLAPDMPAPLMNYAWNLHLAGRSAEALPLIIKVTEREGADALCWTNRSQIHLALDQVAEAHKAAAKAVEIGPTEAMPHLALGLALLRIGDYATGLREYEARFPYVLQDTLKYPYPMWRGEDITNKRLFIVGEQGLGDSVQFMRFIPWVAKLAAKIIVHTHAPCLQLFKDSLPANVEVHPIPRELPAADVYCPMMSLPVAMDYAAKDFKRSFYPYQNNYPSPFDFPADGVRRIGLCWAGDPRHDNDTWRSTTLTDLLPLGEIPNTQLYSFQIGARRADLDTVGANGLVKDLSPFINTVSDSMALMAHMDCVVSVDTAAVHIAGSIGVKTYMLTPRRGLDWRWQEGEGKTIWYPSVEMMRQKIVGDWPEVITRLRAILTHQFLQDPVSLADHPDLSPSMELVQG